MSAAHPGDIGIVLPNPPTTGPNQDYHRELRAALELQIEAIQFQIQTFGDDAMAALWMVGL